jgi:hypothetical protein
MAEKPCVFIFDFHKTNALQYGQVQGAGFKIFYTHPTSQSRVPGNQGGGTGG